MQATGTNAGVWGSDGTTPTANSSNALNQGAIQLLDQALGGTTTLSLSSSTPIALTQLQTQNGMLRLTGTLLASIVISPDSGVLWTGLYSWENVTSGSFSVTITNSAGSVVLPQSRRGLLWIDTTNGPRIISIVGSATADPVPAGSATIWYNSAAPSGWTVVNVNDFCVKIATSGGGSTSGSVAYSTLFNRTQVDGHTLTTDEIPSHNHLAGNATSAQTGSSASIQYLASTSSVSATSSTGGGGVHIHGLDMRVFTAVFTLASRN